MFTHVNNKFPFLIFPTISLYILFFITQWQDWVKRHGKVRKYNGTGGNAIMMKAVLLLKKKLQEIQKKILLRKRKRKKSSKDFFIKILSLKIDVNQICIRPEIIGMKNLFGNVIYIKCAFL